MGIETQGPRAYDHQYRATILITLRALAATDPPTRAAVEEAGGEDATIEFNSSGIISRVEVQVKTAKGDFDLNSLAEALLHFPPHSDQGCLLERLRNDDHTRLLVVTEARAKDEGRGFLAGPGQLATRQTTSPLGPEGIAELAKAVRKVFAQISTALGKRRALACDVLAAELRSGSRLIAALDRIFIWEQCYDRRVRDEIVATLTRHPFYVPLAEAEITLGELTDKVRAARDQRADALPGMREVLEAHRGTRLRGGTVYLPRPEEDAVAAALRTTGVLALTGHPKCGKTTFALEHLDHLQAEGWLCARFDDWAAAQRFLLMADVQNRACLLDDPLEAMQSENLALRLGKLREIGDCCGPARCLLLTARLQTLRRIQPRYKPGTKGPAGFAWQDITVRDSQFAVRVWESLAGASRVDSTIAARVTGMLPRLKSDALLQPGQLAFLARSAPGDLTDRTDAELAALARFNAADIAAQLRQRSPRQQIPIAALGLSGGGVEGVGDTELAFILTDTPERPGWVKDHGREYCANAVPRGFPKYSVAWRLDQSDLDLVSELEGLGFIDRRANRSRFTHPDHAEAFFQAADALASEPSRLLLLLERALSCLDPGVAGFALRMLDAIWSATAPGDDEAHRQLAGRVFRETIFPDVQEIALSLLLAKLKRFPEDEVEDLMRSLVSSRDLDSLLVWANDTPWLDRGPQSFAGSHSARSHRELPRDQIHEICARLKDPVRASTVKPREADATNTFFLRNEEERLDQEALRRIALFDLSFLRTDALQLLCSGRVRFDTETSRLLHDTDPRVSAQALQTCLEHWHVHAAAGDAEEVKRTILRVLERLPVAVLTTSFLFDFGDPHSDCGRVPWTEHSPEQTKELWEVWTDCMHVVLPKLAPYRLYFKDGDLWTSLRAATGFVARAKLRTLFEVWIDWIEVRGKAEPLSDYSLAVVDTALSAATLAPDDREAIIRRCLACSRSDPVIESLKSLVDRWRELSKRERALATDFFSTCRPDHAWLAAAVLVRDCPPELLALLTGDRGFYSRLPKSVIKLLPPAIMRACLGILCRRVPAYSGLNVTAHHRFWHEVWHCMLFEPTHPDGRLLLQDLVFRIGIPIARRGPKRRQYLGVFARLCSTADRPQRQMLFDGLMTLAVYATEPELTECWNLLFAACTDDGERERLAEVITEHIEALDSARSPFGRLGNDWLELVLKRLPSDYIVVSLFRLTRDAEKPFSHSLPTIKLLYDRLPPRTVTIHDRVVATLKQSRQRRSGFFKKVSGLRHAALEKVDASHDAFPDAKPDLNGWIF